MNKEADVPEWALERAAEEANKAIYAEGAWNKKNVGSLYIGRAFARYIAEHEQPPVDPDLIRAREICIEVTRHRVDKAAYRSGLYDNNVAIKAVLRVLKGENS